MRKHLIRLQIQSVTGKDNKENDKKSGIEEDGPDATKKIMLDEARKILSFIDESSEFPSHLIDLLDPVGKVLFILLLLLLLFDINTFDCFIERHCFNSFWKCYFLVPITSYCE